MDLLSRHSGGLRSLRTAALVVAASLAGCALLRVFDGGEEPLAFSHRLHIEDEGLDCTDCHMFAEDDDEPGMPVLAQCLLCHEDLDAEKAPERQVASLFEGDTWAAEAYSELGEEPIFSHLRHVEAGADCALCHEGIEQSERLDASVAVTMQECIDCHEGLNQRTECSTCHSEVDREWRPPTHEKAWTRMHGSAFRAHGSEMVAQCSMCHTDSSCADCHQITEPASHNNYWRRRGHSIQASIDRSSCATCHRTDACDRCHSESAPLSHRGSWGSTRNRHCLGCHFPLRGEGCATCHQGAPSHALATPMPGWHNPAMNCRQCHGQGAPMPHVDNGDRCTLCHQ